MKFNTKTIHGGQDTIDPAHHSVMPPIYQTTTFKLSSPKEHSVFSYSRTSNPTRVALESAVASLENGKYGIAFSSGVASIDAVLKLLKPGDEVITTTDLYGGTYRLFNGMYKDLGIKFHFVPLDNILALEDLINQHTKLVWVESPTNPLMNIIDLSALGKITSKHSIKLVVDNTFASPYLQTPLDLGADIVMHSASKYLSGHSDVILGALVVNDEALAKRLFFIQNAGGAIPGPMDCYLVYRGIKTLHVRMQRHCENAKKIAEFLNEHPKVEKVFWPGLDSHPNHEIAKAQMTDFGGVVSFRLKNDPFVFIQRLKLFTLAESLGGVESLVGHPASMSHASVPQGVREQSGITASLVRLSVGIEDAQDLIKDLENALGN